MPWRALVVMAKLPVKVQVSFSFLAVQLIKMREAKKIVIETDTSSFEFDFLSSDDLEQAVSHMITSLKKVFPGSSPGDLLQNASPSLLARIQGTTDSLEEAWKESPCGGFSETYAALCDYSGLSVQEEIQWDVDNIYHARGCREFNLLDFNHLPSQDIALCVASLSFNQWFTKLSCKDFKLNQVILEEILLALRKSVTLKELELENCGLKCDFAQQMALVLQEYPDSALNSLNLSRNLLEDRGIIALSQTFEQRNKGFQSLNFARTSVTQKGMMALCQSFINNGQFRISLSHLDLSGNPGSLLAEGGNGLFSFLSQPNVLGHLNLSGSDCALDMLFGALAGGCCVNLTHLNLCKNVYSHKKSRGDPFAIGQFLSQASALQHVSLSGTKLPPEALRALLQALANNTQLKNLNLDLSSCELRSAGAQVIQDLISDASSICDLNLSDNGFDSDMVTLVLSLNRSKSIKHVALGKNFNIQSRETLVDTLHRIVQLTQDEDCSLESVSVAESRLKLRTSILLDGLGSNSHLVALDISGNAMGDLGAKILAKALSVNKTLRTLIWDRNNITLYGFLDVISALERNFILTKMPLPMNDIAVAYRSHPEKMEEIVHQIQSYLARNQIQANLLKEKGQLQLDSQANSSEQAVKDACQTVQKYIGLLSCVQDVEVKADLLWAEEAIKDATLFMDILPVLYEVGRASYQNCKLQHKLEKLIEEVSRTYSKEIQAVVQSQLDATQSLHPQILQRTDFLKQLFCDASETTFLDQLLTEVYDKVMKIQLSITEAMTGIITEKTLEELTTIQDRLVAAQWRHTCSLSLLPTPSLNGLSELALKVGAEDNKIGSPQPELSLSRASAKSRPASTKDAEPGSGLLLPLPPCTEPASAASLMDLPTAGEKLEHYTRDRPRPNRRNRQPPSKSNAKRSQVRDPGAAWQEEEAAAPRCTCCARGPITLARPPPTFRRCVCLGPAAVALQAGGGGKLPQPPSERLLLRRAACALLQEPPSPCF
ncbi:capping protein, Arp2/3 and myosin-I linker protein 2 [Pantherophis guttatus]|uniref:Capping protein, Arp2/3 and myosin-I linker protein 2 n=1 Tax=Pantherophis guttatus TaxID=94885 RepID=A0ABM3YN97_PANGU|nr:capping protein, Arp2/3 and myosin-I linker protein 2 [Pantherophis guttatus]